MAIPPAIVVPLGLGSVPKPERALHGELDLFGINLARLPTLPLFVVLASGVFIWYMLYGYLQELIFTKWKEQDIRLGWFLTLVQFVVYGILSGLQRWLELPAHGARCCRNVFHRVTPMRVYWTIGFWSVATIGLSNASCEVLNYPTQVVFKCCKLIPVMAMGVLITGKRYSFLDYGVAFLFCLGLIVFTLADKAVSPDFDLYGVFLISLALVADAFIGNLQEKSFADHEASASETLLFVKGTGCVYLTVVVIWTSQLLSGITYCIENPHVLAQMVVFSVSGWIGENFIMLLVKRFGAVVTVTLTSARKVLTIVLSFLIFPKPYSHGYLVGGAMVFGALMFNAVRKNQREFSEGVSRCYHFMFTQYSSVAVSEDTAEEV